MSAKIITFEGIDGSGKSTLATKVREHYEGVGLLCWQTSEPRSYIPLTDPFIATMQLMADRRAHCELIKKIVLTTDLILVDRFDLSTEAYQGYGDGVDIHLIQQLNLIATNGINVTRRILLDVPINIAVERVMARGEKMTVDDVVRLERVRAGYAHMADKRGILAACVLRRMQAIDASQSPDRVLADAIKLIDEVLGQ